MNEPNGEMIVIEGRKCSDRVVRCSVGASGPDKCSLQKWRKQEVQEVETRGKRRKRKGMIWDYEQMRWERRER
jgi:hypothetical protein